MNASAPMSAISEDDIAQYLVNTPDFFVRHAQLLASVQLSSPHSGRVVSLFERQVEVLRERLRQLQQRIDEMVQYGCENAGLLDRLHRWTCDLLAVDDPAALPAAVCDGLAQRFDVPQIALKLWGVAAPWRDMPSAQGVSDDVRALADSLRQPYCGKGIEVEPLQWLLEPATVASLALLPLRRAEDAPAFGLLVLASSDVNRFQASAGTDFLAQIGDVAAAALSRLLAPTA